MLHRSYDVLAAYNEWANARLYAAAARLSDADYRADKGAFFGSIHRTLNHLLVVDRIWMDRFMGLGCRPPSLDRILFDDLAALRMARAAEDTRIRAFVKALTLDDLLTEITFTLVTGEEMTQTVAAALDHFFNHQTHHRGQMHCVLTIIGGRDAAPALDLLFYQREHHPVP